jgi:RNA polymerase sigma-70 factor (ECF subfamily)
MRKLLLQRFPSCWHRRGVTGHQPSDSEILASLPDRPEAMGVLYERHAAAVFRYLARRAGPSTAEDLLSEVFIAALDGGTRVVAHESGSALPWLYGIAMNVLRRNFRQKSARRVAAQDPEMDWDAVDARLDAEAKREQLRSALNVLSHHDRELLLLVAWEGLTPAEAAEVLGIGKVAARSRLHRARRRALQALDCGVPNRPAVEMTAATGKEMPA